MKKINLVLILVLILIQACKEDNVILTCISADETDVVTNDCLDNWDCQFNFMPDSRLNLDVYYGVEMGDRNVFQMINHTEGDQDIRDDEETHILVFELEDNSQNSFSLEDEDLELMQVSFRHCCWPTDFFEVRLGCLSGEKDSNTGGWNIQGNLTVYFGPTYFKEIKFDSVFE